MQAVSVFLPPKHIICLWFPILPYSIFFTVLVVSAFLNKFYVPSCQLQRWFSQGSSWTVLPFWASNVFFLSFASLILSVKRKKSVKGVSNNFSHKSYAGRSSISINSSSSSSSSGSNSSSINVIVSLTDGWMNDEIYHFIR